MHTIDLKVIVVLLCITLIIIGVCLILINIYVQRKDSQKREEYRAEEFKRELRIRWEQEDRWLEEWRRAEEVKRQEELRIRKEREARRLEEQRKAEEAKRQEELRIRKEREARRLEEQRKVEEAKRQEELRIRKEQEARRLEEKHKAEEAKRQEELCIRKEQEARRLEEQRKAEEAKGQEGLRIHKEQEARQLEVQRKVEEAKRQEGLLRIKEARMRMRMCLENNAIRYFYHFTSEANKDSIERLGGLYSWAEMERQGHSIPCQGGGDLSRALDRRFGLQDYVRLSFCKDHPMAFRLHKEGYKLLLLKFDALAMIEAGLLDNAIFSDMNATDNNHQKDWGIEGLHLIDFKATQRSYVARTDPDFKHHQAEIMIPKCVPYSYILSVENMSFSQSARGEYVSLELLSDEQKKILERLGLL